MEETGVLENLTSLSHLLPDFEPGPRINQLTSASKARMLTRANSENINRRLAERPSWATMITAPSGHELCIPFRVSNGGQGLTLTAKFRSRVTEVTPNSGKNKALGQ